MCGGKIFARGGAEFWRRSRCHCRGFALRSERLLESLLIFLPAPQLLCQDFASANDPASFVSSYVKPTSVINRNVPMLNTFELTKQSGTNLKEKRTAVFFFFFFYTLLLTFVHVQLFVKLGSKGGISVHLPPTWPGFICGLSLASRVFLFVCLF